jgi:hypothetical protein
MFVNAAFGKTIPNCAGLLASRYPAMTTNARPVFWMPIFTQKTKDETGNN